MKTITINGRDILRPNDFTPSREDVYAAEYTTCTGKLIADRIGWKYADMTLSWDTLPQAMLDVLTGMNGEATLAFEDNDGLHTERIIRGRFANIPTRFTGIDGNAAWQNISVEVRFIDVHY
ncbi:hypothetical protein SAMN05216515_10682 [Eubacterium pyruvativorans]|uniref:Phage tail tube protein n=1 Tax=Eubacterium pyruvativorans TaxID=155865 RepID=A0A1I7G9A0_9FIRM|nr:hypothetical protein [Eubacterium pyruvativorans]SFO07754.1 hypothetical protein SAMN05216515_10682 [Eubacterium pyruvativorans]SFU45002.1 hypothetical protein SAMN05216508_10581 [Eubacterium pyruvativorans]